MAQGGKREGAGRKKSERPIDGNVARKIKARVRAEELWVSAIDLERRRLGINQDGSLSEQEKNALLLERTLERKGLTGGYSAGVRHSIIPLLTALRYLDDRDLGRPHDTVKHIHSKPVDVVVTHNLSDRFRIAMEKAAKRVRDGR